MKIQKKDLIFIHKFIWSYIYKEVKDYQYRNGINCTLGFNIKQMKNKAISLLLENEIITNTLFNYLSHCNFCILCLVVINSENGCIDCPLKDCSLSSSKYIKAYKGSLHVIRDIYYSIDEVFIPDYIEIPEE